MVLNPQPKTRAERAFHLVERALLRTLFAGGSQFSIFSQLPLAKGRRGGGVLRRLHAVAQAPGGCLDGFGKVGRTTRS